MRRRLRHRWRLSPKQAIALQLRLAPRVERRDRLDEVRTVAGVDVGYDEERGMARAAVVALSFPGLRPVDWAVARVPVRFPYVPGLLSFREIPAALAAFERLRRMPDLILCDGQGIAHPRRFGIASHLGLLLDRPTIGVAKTRLVGEHRAPAQRRGAWTPLTDAGEVIGAVLRTRAGARPLYVSIGHRVSLATALAWVLACTPRYRLPETTRAAHRLASGAATP
ncbi:MAG: deoxyribonuclease V [Pseudomonadota bacterium]